MSDNWNKKYAYLSSTRDLYHNDDYIEFLVDKVWKLTHPIKMIDVGCGYGYVGLKLLPLLKQGSSYTGVDIASTLLEKGKGIFRNSPYVHTFIASSVYNIPEEDSTYDLAICHAVMMHLDDPQLAVQEMKRVVKPGGLLIAIESNWNAANTLSCIDGLNKCDTTDLGFLQQLFENNRQQKKKDGNIGIKMPILFYKEGLKDIQARTSDCVNVLLPSVTSSERDKLYTSLGNDGFGNDIHGVEFSKKVQYFMEYGFSKEESEKQALMEKNMCDYFIAKKEDLCMTFSAAMTYSFGTVEK